MVDIDINDHEFYGKVLDWAKENDPEQYQKLCDLLQNLSEKSVASMEDAPVVPPADATPPGPPPSTLVPTKFGESGSVVMTPNPDGSRSFVTIIAGEVLYPSKYLQLIDTLYHAKKGDQVFIKIASPGGMVETGVAILTAIENTQAKVTTIGMGLVASIASIIWMAGHDRIMMPGATLMVHGPSGMQAGKVSTIKDEVEQISAYFEDLLRTLSKGILTEEQLNHVLTTREDLFIPGETLEATRRTLL